MPRLLCSLLAVLLFAGPVQAQSEPAADPDPGLLVLAPDRGFLGNEKARDVVADVRDHTENVGLAFATSEETTSNLTEALSTIDTENGVVVLPLFLSVHHTLYQTARAAMPQVEGGVQWAAPFGSSYLSEELLFDRVAALSERPGDEALVVVGYGATDRTGADSVRADLQASVQRAAEKHGLAGGGEVVVQYARSAPEKASRAAIGRATKTVKTAAGEHERVLVVPYNLGMQYTSMMSSWSWMKRPLGSIDGVVASGEGVLPHPNLERWIRRTATTYRPLSPDEVGVIAVPHGSEYNWNETMREGLAPLTDDYTIAEAFSMVDPPVIERAVRQLENEGVKAAVMVRIFSMESNFQEKAHYILGLRDTFGRSIMGERFPERIPTHLQMTTLGGLEASPHFAKGLLDRAQAISENPSEETILLLAHGTGSDEKNAHWMENLLSMADTMRAHGGDAFRDIKVHTWREDWPEKRKQTIPEIQQMVKEASENGTALVVPARTTAQGRASQYLEGLDYRYGKGFAPHPQFEAWMREQIETGIDRLQAAPQSPDSATTTAQAGE
jgi:sirohydrochlorin ferrochelatase